MFHNITAFAVFWIKWMQAREFFKNLTVQKLLTGSVASFLNETINYFQTKKYWLLTLEHHYWFIAIWADIPISTF